MQLQTHIPLKPEKKQIGYSDKLLLLGSCFVENIGKKLDYYKFSSFLNPFGILFHPQAVLNLLERVEQQREFTEEDVFFLNERWHCYEVHSDFSNPSRETILANLNKVLYAVHESLKEVDYVVITPGTAWAYELRNTHRVVANCHKVPQKEFNKVLWSVPALQRCLRSIVDLVHRYNQKAKIIFTVSPVRHLKDGFVENQRSKACLLTAVHDTIRDAVNSLYFPSYEIMMDELRDYRFYNADMVHPNEVAIDYIWEKFKEVWIDPKATELMGEIDKIQKGLAHKPFNPNSEQHHAFLEKIQNKIKTIQKQYPSIKFS
ncbi:GSCFA domain-containing protein [Zhouia amylolytica]|uniref:GSCFA family protein n=1 Tax=Zhouia amylolytica AD3 TaxID=1286632 RepID=W2UKR5_9FLAO|nr:GSCFA domain-containing protein [Zhouia amylolytica]ETN93917.1 GSCFA family protein [Zhouia amylolytica AD3]